VRSDALRLIGVLAVVGALAFVVTRVDAGSGEARPSMVDASGAASLTNSVAGDAVVRARDLKPGARATGTVTVSNGGDATGAFRVAQTDVLDAPGAGDGRLSTAARLRIDDARDGQPIYEGLLGAMQEHPLGYLRAGEKRTYRFTLTLPDAAPAGAFAGARVETRFDWTATTGEPPARDSAPPTVLVGLARSSGATLTLALTCNRRCSIVGVSRGARIASPRKQLLPGQPALQPIELAPGAALPLRITIADAAGRRTTVTTAGP